jgi:hypothetical protein
MDETAQTAPPAGSGSTASPNGPPLSRTTSAKSVSLRPEGWRDSTCAPCCKDVMAMTGWPFLRATSAMPTMLPLMPEFDAMTKTSFASMGARSYSRCARSGSRSVRGSRIVAGSAPPYMTRSDSAIRLVGMSPPARPAISMAVACECPVPKACTTPPSRTDRATMSAARCTPSSCDVATPSTISVMRARYAAALTSFTAAPSAEPGPARG